MNPGEFFDSQHWVASSKAWWLMANQAVTGIGFDKVGACALRERISQMMIDIASDVEPKLPLRSLNKGETDYYRIPAKPFKMDGTFSSSMEKWMEKVGGKLYTQRDVEISGQVFPIVGGKETITTGVMRLANQDDIKDWLLSQGWKPTLFNLKKDKRGKPERDQKGNYIQTSPKMQEGGKLCPNLERMEGPLAKSVCKWLSLRNRKSVIEGWLENERLAFDGRLGAGASGITPTTRFKHSVVVNLPKAEDGVLLGKEMRSLFVAPRPGYVFVGYDAAAIEARNEAHYCYPYQGGVEYADDLINGDIHMKTVEKVFFDKVAHVFGTDRWSKDDPDVKPWRSKAKAVRYASSYGAQSKKMASVLGCSVREAQGVLDSFWEAAKPLAIFKDKITQYWETTGQKRFIKGIDDRIICTRAKHAVVNSAFQSCGAIAMDYSAMFMDKWLGGLVLDKSKSPCYSYKGEFLYRVAFIHDELLWEVPEHLANEIGEMGVKSIESAGRVLKMRVPLAGEYKVGVSWAATH